MTGPVRWSCWCPWLDGLAPLWRANVCNRLHRDGVHCLADLHWVVDEIRRDSQWSSLGGPKVAHAILAAEATGEEPVTQGVRTPTLHWKAWLA